MDPEKMMSTSLDVSCLHPISPSSPHPVALAEARTDSRFAPCVRVGWRPQDMIKANRKLNKKKSPAAKKTKAQAKATPKKGEGSPPPAMDSSLPSQAAFLRRGVLTSSPLLSPLRSPPLSAAQG